MSPSPQTAALPPLPNLQGGGSPGGGGDAGSSMSALVSGLAPVKSAVDQIIQACQMIVHSGAIPGAEQPCGQIVALAASLLPMAAQQAMMPGQGAGGIGGPVGAPGPGAPAPGPGGPPPGM